MRWDLHGVSVQATAADGFLRQVIAEGMESLPRSPAAGQQRSCEYRATFSAKVPDRAGWALLGQVPMVKGKVVLPLVIRTASDPDRLAIDYGGRASAHIDYESRQIEVAVHDPRYFQAYYDPLYTSSVLFKSLLLEVLPEHGTYPLHAGMCELGGSGVIVCGEPGTGKTLLVLVLTQRGFGYLSDELGFITAGAGPIECLAFPIRGRLRLPTGATAPVLPDEAMVERTNGQAVFAPARLPGRLATRAIPRILLNVTGTTEGASRLTACDALDALQALTLYEVYYGDRHKSSQFTICADLAGQVSAYDVLVGTDYDALARQVGRLVASD